MNILGHITTKYANVNVGPGGSGLSNLKWIESPMKYSTKPENLTTALCSVSYAALNFRDVMLATGKLAAEAIPGKPVVCCYYCGQLYTQYTIHNMFIKLYKHIILYNVYIVHI